MPQNAGAYTRTEDKAILDFISKDNRILFCGGTQVWKKAESENICPGRTFWSLRERFRRTILKNLNRYNLDEKLRKKIVGFTKVSAPGKAKLRFELAKPEDYQYVLSSKKNDSDDETSVDEDIEDLSLLGDEEEWVPKTKQNDKVVVKQKEKTLQKKKNVATKMRNFSLSESKNDIDDETSEDQDSEDSLVLGDEEEWLPKTRENDEVVEKQKDKTPQEKKNVATKARNFSFGNKSDSEDETSVVESLEDLSLSGDEREWLQKAEGSRKVVEKQKDKSSTKQKNLARKTRNFPSSKNKNDLDDETSLDEDSEDLSLSGDEKNSLSKAEKSTKVVEKQKSKSPQKRNVSQSEKQNNAVAENPKNSKKVVKEPEIQNEKSPKRISGRQELKALTKARESSNFLTEIKVDSSASSKRSLRTTKASFPKVNSSENSRSPRTTRASSPKYVIEIEEDVVPSESNVKKLRTEKNSSPKPSVSTRNSASPKKVSDTETKNRQKSGIAKEPISPEKRKKAVVTKKKQLKAFLKSL